MIPPSKELLSAVLDLTLPFEAYIVGNTITIHLSSLQTDDCGYEINVYELAHKCKEWAVNLKPNKHTLSSYPRWNNIRDYPETNGNYYICQHLVTGIQFEAETEPEAVFKACEYLKEIE